MGDDLQSQLFQCVWFTDKLGGSPQVLGEYNGYVAGWQTALQDLEADPAWQALDPDVRTNVRVILQQLGTPFLFSDFGLSFATAVAVVRHGGRRQIVRLNRRRSPLETDPSLQDYGRVMVIDVEPWRRRINACVAQCKFCYAYNPGVCIAVCIAVVLAIVLVAVLVATLHH